MWWGNGGGSARSRPGVQSAPPPPTPSDVLERPYTARGRGGYIDPPPPRTPPLLPFQCLRLTTKIVLRRLRCQED